MTIDCAAQELADLVEAEQWSALAARLRDSREPADVWLRTIATNMSALRERRPAIYERILEALAAGDIDLNAFVVSATADRVVLDAYDAIAELREHGRCIAIAGIGDGSLLRAMAKFPPALRLGREQEVVLIEPDLRQLIAGLGGCDLSGPISLERFSWYVGEGWIEELVTELVAQPTKMIPLRTVHASGSRPEIESGMAEVESRLDGVMDERKARVRAYYDAIDDAELLSLFGPNPPRRPRVLMLTSQFTAVLQYSTYDTADAFRKLGWDVEVCTEAKMWHLMGRPAMIAALDAFKPDLVFQIDHLRYEYRDVFPAKLPFICWIQDHLTNLTSNTAGESITPRDFVLTGGVYRYVTRYNYPRQQCIDMPKVSREPVLPTSWTCDREDLFYVSHWSHTPESIIVETCNRVRELGGPGAEAAMRACTSELTHIYAHGGSVRTDLETRKIVRDVFARRGEVTTAESERFYVDVLFQRLNNAYYRQQALLWAQRIADEMGLKFGIYGIGWEKHPQLSRNARGVVKYGPDLEKLTRESKILLQLEPYACYTHQRMLDALLAGGFAIIREHPLNRLPIKVRQFLDANVPPHVNSVDEARRAMSAAQNAAFDALLNDAEILTVLGDVVDVIRGWQRARIIGDGDEALPHLDAIGFDSYETMKDRVQTFVHDESARRRIAGDQRASVAQRLTYTSAVRRAMGVVYERLSDVLKEAA